VLPCSAGPNRKHQIDTSFHIGKALVSPFTRLLAPGRYTSAVSIRTGRGRATHDRVLRFVPEFDSPDAALRYAAHQARAWLGVPVLAPACPESLR